MGDKYIDNPTTLGDHLRNRRLELGLLQKEVAQRTGVTEECVTLWETNHTIPRVSSMPKVIQFLGYNPIQIDTSTLEGKITAYRTLHGLSLKKLAALLGVNPSTVTNWELGKHRPKGKLLEKLLKVLREE